MKDSDINRQIKNYLKLYGIKKKELAKMLGVTPQTITNWLHKYKISKAWREILRTRGIIK